MRVSYPVTGGRLNLLVMAAAFTVFGLSLVFQPHRWASTPAYHVLLQIFTAQAWGGLFLASGITLGAAARWYERRWLVVTALVPALGLTAGWMLAFVARYLSSPDTTPETWVSWAVFGFLLLKTAAGLDLPRSTPVRELPEVTAYRQAVDDALAAADAGRQAAVTAALGAETARLRENVAAACDAYGQALAAVTPAGAMPAGDPARTALAEARNALLRAEEAFERATGKPARGQDGP